MYRLVGNFEGQHAFTNIVCKDDVWDAESNSIWFIIPKTIKNYTKQVFFSSEFQPRGRLSRMKNTPENRRVQSQGCKGVAGGAGRGGIDSNGVWVSSVAPRLSSYRLSSALEDQRLCGFFVLRRIRQFPRSTRPRQPGMLRTIALVLSLTAACLASTKLTEDETG